MDDDIFISRMRDKICRLTGQAVELQIDHNDPNQLQVDYESEVPLVLLGANVLRYSGFARMCIEYAVASIKERRPLETLEFHLLLARN